ncbi:hypothetical protein EV177_006572 [Coemansia sp. RSA 1804]|nr:hypothetical protein EV177_006572 [Coemansia sp. RSA 1804]
MACKNSNTNAFKFKPDATNSLVVIFDHFSDDACTALNSKLEDCGPLWHFVRLKSFGRCFAVFSNTLDAQKALHRLNLTEVLPGNKMRMYYSMHTPQSQTQNNFLNVPAQEKLWLISPPGSPAINWRQTREDPPNATHLERRLEEALQELSFGQFSLNPKDVADYNSAGSDDDSTSLPEISRTLNRSHDGQAMTANSDILLTARQQQRQQQQLGVGMAHTSTPTILIQNCDIHAGSHDQQVSGSSLTSRPPTPGTFPRHIPPTARPPPQ